MAYSINPNLPKARATAMRLLNAEQCYSIRENNGRTKKDCQ